jgi:hypothetical protein
MSRIHNTGFSDNQSTRITTPHLNAQKYMVKMYGKQVYLYDWCAERLQDFNTSIKKPLFFYNEQGKMRVENQKPVNSQKPQLKMLFKKSISGHATMISPVEFVHHGGVVGTSRDTSHSHHLTERPNTVNHRNTVKNLNNMRAAGHGLGRAGRHLEDVSDSVGSLISG